MPRAKVLQASARRAQQSAKDEDSPLSASAAEELGDKKENRRRAPSPHRRGEF